MTQSIVHPRISFGIIVLNGEPFTRYNLRNIYEFAYEIVIAEGASFKASHVATSDGHSIDGTLELLRKFQKEEDLKNKIQIITAEDEGYSNGFWPGEKDQQSQAYAKRCTGDFLWQLDIDEFYEKADIEKIIGLLSKTKEDACFTVKAHNYFLSPQIEQVGSYFNHPCFQGEPWGRFRRIFSWGDGYQYISHRPPTVINSHGEIIHKLHKVDITSNLDISMHHYSVFSISNWHSKLLYYKKQKWSYDSRRGLNLEELKTSKNWRKITNQYNTINTLRKSQKTIHSLNKIYEECANKETREITNEILKEISNINYFSKLTFSIASEIDSFFRNFMYPIRKIGSELTLKLERVLYTIGLRQGVNESRRRSKELR